MQVTDGHREDLQAEWDAGVAAEVADHRCQVPSGRGATHGHPIRVNIELLCLLRPDLHGVSRQGFHVSKSPDIMGDAH